MASPTYFDFILIVDDNPNNLAVLSSMLKDAGFAVRVAVDGESAIEQLSKGLPSLILLDVMMPGIDGFETCRRLKENPETFEVPVIFMTALADSEHKTKGLSIGAVDYITKPFNETEVIARIRIHLKTQNLLQTLKSQNQRLKQEIGQRQQAEQQLQQLNDELEHRVGLRTAQLQKMQVELVQNEKMASLGNLVAGVAHEINNPIGFLNGSVDNAQTYFSDLVDHLSLYREGNAHDDAIQENAEDIDLDFILEDFPKLIESMKAANQRIKAISNSLRTFSRADTEHMTSVNLHEGLDSTLLILKYRLKANDHRPAIEVVKHYGDLPEVECFPSQLNQVFMNLLANAIDVFDETAEQHTYKEAKKIAQIITITTCVVEQAIVEIRIGDNGRGMPEAIKAQIFDHLFTTKAIGKGTGLGLVIAQQIVTESHGGQLNVQSELGQGTEFLIRLPITSTL
ncbi:MAG: response regulator [Cyanobacteria bacterium P01_A01_bin.17]